MDHGGITISLRAKSNELGWPSMPMGLFGADGNPLGGQNLENEGSRLLLAVTTRMGWKTYGKRLNEEALKRDDGIDFVPFSPWSWARRIYWQTNYSDRTPKHIRLLDPFTVMAWQVACIPTLWRDYSAAIVATQGVAAGLLSCRPKLPIFLVIDATRQLYRDEFGSSHISDEDIERETSVFQRCSHIFSLSHWAAKSIIEYSSIPRNKVTVLPPACPTSFPQDKSVNAPTRTRLKVLFVGIDFERKGGKRLLEWQRSILHKYVNLHIVTELRNRDLSVPNTTWLGAVDNNELTSKIMPDMDLLLHPTQKDCSSIIVVEAAMCGLPSIVSSIGGVQDLVESGVTGLVIDPQRDADFIQSVLFFHYHRSALSAFSNNARLKAEREFSADKVYNRIMDVVRSHPDVVRSHVSEKHVEQVLSVPPG